MKLDEKSEDVVLVSKDEIVDTTEYVNDLLVLKGLPKGYSSIIHLFPKKLLKAEDGQRLYLNTGMKQEFADELKVSIGYISNCITELVKADMLQRIKTGTYLLNPELFGEYSWIRIDTIVRIKVFKEYLVGGTKTRTNFTHNPNAFILRLDPEPSDHDLESEE